MLVKGSCTMDSGLTRTTLQQHWTWRITVSHVIRRVMQSLKFVSFYLLLLPIDTIDAMVERKSKMLAIPIASLREDFTGATVSSSDPIKFCQPTNGSGERQ
jgi:hypothetical protein